MVRFRGKPPGSNAGEMSHRTERLRPALGLPPAQVTQARQLRRAGQEPHEIAQALGVAVEEVERALLQMRSPRPETTRGTLNVTLAAHRIIMQERVGDEPIWQTMDRLVDELLRLRAEASGRPPAPAARRRRSTPQDATLPLPLPGGE